MPTTPRPSAGAQKPCNLPGVTEEKEIILDVTKGHLTQHLLEHPNVEQVVAGVQTCCVAHFACHGSTGYADPSKSGLILQRHGDDQAVEQDRLTVHGVSNLHLKQACMTYLSACSTAENKACRTRCSDLSLLEIRRNLVRRRQNVLPKTKKVKWALYDRGHFKEMLENLTKSISELIELFLAAKDKQGQLRDEEMAAFIGSLGELQAAIANQGETLPTVLSQLLNLASETYNLEMSGVQVAQQERTWGKSTRP
ncbi:hypothetical protein OQA88_6290 [Cercophora sp. LCS_1]